MLRSWDEFVLLSWSAQANGRKQISGRLTAAEQVAFKCNWGLADNLITSINHLVTIMWILLMIALLSTYRNGALVSNGISYNLHNFKQNVMVYL